MKPSFLLMALLITSPALAQSNPATTQGDTDQATLEKQLEQTLSNATLVGHFTIDGAPNAPLKEDRYTLGPVKKVAGDNWLLPARIGSRQMLIPLILPIKWAGDTPVITVTNFGIPGMGSYTARVVLYGDHYAGFWSAGPTHQGSMYGRIEHPPTTQPTKDAN
jgi:hypothetical protein